MVVRRRRRRRRRMAPAGFSACPIHLVLRGR